VSAAKPTSLRAYAKRRGVSAEAVSKAIMSGRLRESVVMVGGQPKIRDVDLADREWGANTRPRVDLPPPREPGAPIETGAADGGELGPVPDYNEWRARREQQAARREAALADLAEIERDEKLETLVDAEEAKRDVIELFTIVKTKVLGVPSRVGQRLPHLAAEIVPVIDALLRETLEELATEPPDDEAEAEA
jgi:hypothetical protein